MRPWECRVSGANWRHIRETYYMTPNPIADISELHECYCAMTGRSPKLAVFQRLWWDFQKAGYVQDDLIIVLRFMLRENQRNNYKYGLGLAKLIGDLERYDDLLNEAKAKTRNRIKPKTNRESVLAAFRKAPEPQREQVCQSVKDLLRKIVA